MYRGLIFEEQMAYPVSFKESMIEKMLRPGGPTPTELSVQEDVPPSTLRGWRKQAVERGDMDQSDSAGNGSRRRRRRRPKQKIRIVMEAAGLSDDELGAFLRKEGLHHADLKRLREEVMQAAQKGFEKPKKRGLSPAEKQLKKVKKELVRKEKALAETAAILVLRGKLEAFLSAEEDGDTTGKTSELMMANANR